MANIKLLKNGIKVNGIYTKCWYSPGDRLIINGEFVFKPHVTIYCDTYLGFPKGIEAIGAVKNDTDSQTDYFDRDKINVFEGNPYYPEIIKLSIEKKIADKKRYLTTLDKRISKSFGNKQAFYIREKERSLESLEQLKAVA